jgi:hypothetical protein
MNERIEQLSLQARAMISKGVPFDQGFKLYSEKFAGLIVLECANIAAEAGEIMFNRALVVDPRSFTYNMIIELLGVEE